MPLDNSKWRRPRRFSGSRVLDILIIQTLWMPWIFGLAAFTAISFSIGTLFNVLSRLTAGVLSWDIAIQVLVLQLPSFVVLALPMSLLFAPLITYSQLARTNELMALKSSGISLFRIVLPTFCCSLFVAICTLAMHELVVPSATLHADTLLAQHSSSSMSLIPKQNIVHQVFANQQITQLFYAHQFDGHALHQLTILQFQNRHLRQIWTAKHATWDESQRHWILSQGSRYSINPESGLYQRVTPFQRQAFQTASPIELATSSREPVSIADTLTLLAPGQQRGDEQYLRKLQVRLHTLIAFPWIGVGFSLLGSALGCRSTQSGGPQGFGLSILLIFGHYTFSFVCQTLGEIGTIPAGLSGWLPLITLLMLGVYLLHQANAKPINL